MALPVDLQSATELSLSLNLSISLGGQDCHPHFTDGETGALGAQETLRPWPPSPSSGLTHSWVSILGPGKSWGGWRWLGGSSLSLSGTL